MRCLCPTLWWPSPTKARVWMDQHTIPPLETRLRPLPPYSRKVPWFNGSLSFVQLPLGSDCQAEGKSLSTDRKLRHWGVKHLLSIADKARALLKPRTQAVLSAWIKKKKNQNELKTSSLVGNGIIIMWSCDHYLQYDMRGPRRPRGLAQWGMGSISKWRNHAGHVRTHFWLQLPEEWNILIYVVVIFYATDAVLRALHNSRQIFP